MKKPKGSVTRHIAAVRKSLQALDTSLARLGELLRGFSSRVEGAGPARQKSKATLSGARLKALKLHGRYLGYIRQLKPKQRAEVKVVREKKGVEAAIRKAKRLARG